MCELSWKNGPHFGTALNRGLKADAGRSRSSPVPVPPTGPCQSYRAGHGVHWIHARYVRTERDQANGSAVKATVVTAQDGLLTLDVDGRRLVLTHHDPARVTVLAHNHPKVIWVRRYYVVYFGSYLISVAEPDEVTPCLGGRECALTVAQP